MGMGFAPTWLRQVSPTASQNHFDEIKFRTQIQQTQTIAVDVAHTVYCLPMNPFHMWWLNTQLWH